MYFLKTLGLLALAVLAGCAAPARIEQMSIYSPTGQWVNSPFKKSIAVVEVTGGRETNPAWSSQVSSEAFRRALELSLQNVGLSDPSISANKYQLTADILQLSQPFGGFDMTVSANVRYSLLETSSRKEVFSKVITASHTAKLTEAFAGVERLKIANEGAAKANIQLLIDELIRLPTPQ